MKNTWTKNGYYYVSLRNKTNSQIKSIINAMGDSAEYVHDAAGEIVAIKRKVGTTR